MYFLLLSVRIQPICIHNNATWELVDLQVRNCPSLIQINQLQVSVEMCRSRSFSRIFPQACKITLKQIKKPKRQIHIGKIYQDCIILVSRYPNFQLILQARFDNQCTIVHYYGIVVGRLTYSFYFAQSIVSCNLISISIIRT